MLTALCARAEAQVFLEQGRGGVIINVSSGESTRPSPYMAAYAASKAAINHLTQSLAVELGPSGIRVVAIAPGTTLTETVREAFSDELVAASSRQALQRMSEPEELARLTVFLASDLARCITGQLIIADAGAHLSRTRPSASGRPSVTRPRANGREDGRATASHDRRSPATRPGRGPARPRRRWTPTSKWRATRGATRATRAVWAASGGGAAATGRPTSSPPSRRPASGGWWSVQAAGLYGRTTVRGRHGRPLAPARSGRWSPWTLTACVRRKRWPRRRTPPGWRASGASRSDLVPPGWAPLGPTRYSRQPLKLD